ncbi:MAG: glycoside hydrolase family 3 protein [Lachnospiraceae bacterium]|nr:glycoside hydrolase family 3 protein [Lachnospiraceae bacterium]
MYDEGKKSILSSLLSGLLWIGGLLLLIFAVYKLGFAPIYNGEIGTEEEFQQESEEKTVILPEETSDSEEETIALSETETEPAEAETTESEGTDEVPSDSSESAAIYNYINSMTLEQKVAQLLFITPEELTGVDNATVWGDMSVSAYGEYPVGGLIYFSKNLVDPDQTKEMLQKADASSRENTSLPLFIGIDEEGGRILRLAENKAFNLPKTPSMKELGEAGDSSAVFSAADQIGQYLSEYGFNVDFAPVADILTNPDNTVIGDRSFSSDPGLVASLTAEYAKGLHQHNILSCYKHFPGHGGTTADSHDGSVTLERTLDELRAEEFVPFSSGIAEGIDFIMTAHIKLPNIPEAEELPASLSPYMLTDILRHEMGYNGIIISDALNMKAITDEFSDGDAAVKAFEAGCDMLLMPGDLKTSYDAVLEKIKSGEITEDRLNESLYRIIRAKLTL